jgi:hypothetical protein
MSRRRLHVAPEVAQAMPAAHLAQLQASVDDPESGCIQCGQLFTVAIVEVVVLRDGDFFAARLTHPECARSAIYEVPGLRAVVTANVADTEGLEINTTLGRRATCPRALVFLEPTMVFFFAAPGGDLANTSEDPLAVYATQRGLQPITGRLDQITPEPTSTSRLHVGPDGLVLTNPDGHDTIPADPQVLADWCQAARDDHATAIVITARGLGLTQQPPTINEAIATRPAWGAQVNVTGLPQPRRRWWPRVTKKAPDPARQPRQVSESPGRMSAHDRPRS